MSVFALLGANALWLMYAWLVSAIVASYLSKLKGYGERPGLASGLLLHVVGVVLWLLWPAKAGSRWKRRGLRAKFTAASVADRKSAGSHDG